MLLGAVFGMITAVTLGVNNLLTAVVARRFGVLRSTTTTLTIAFVVMIGWAMVIGVPYEITTDQIILLGLLGAAAATSFLGSYMALRLGPVSVVSPISALSGAVTVLYSYWLLAERPTTVQWIGIPIAAAGAVLASLVIEKGAKIRLVTWGPVFAMIAVLVGSLSNAGLKIPIRDRLDSNWTIITQRFYTVAYVALAFVIIARITQNRQREGKDFPFGGLGQETVEDHLAQRLASGSSRDHRRRFLRDLRVRLGLRPRLADRDALPKWPGNSSDRRGHLLPRTTPPPAVDRCRTGRGRPGDVHRRLAAGPRKQPRRGGTLRVGPFEPPWSAVRYPFSCQRIIQWCVMM